MIMDQRRPPVRPSCATTNAASTTTAETKTKTSNETEEKLVYYILFDCSPSDEWGSYNDNVLSELPWVRRHRPWWNKLLGIRGPSSGRHGREVLLASHFVSVLCVVLHFTWLSKDMNSYLISIHMPYEFICRIWTAYLWQITWIVLRDIFLASIFLAYDKPIGALPRRDYVHTDEDGTYGNILTHNYSTYTVQIGTRKRGECSAGSGLNNERFLSSASL